MLNVNLKCQIILLEFEMSGIRMDALANIPELERKVEPFSSRIN
jgi:hypothetical protein